MEPASLADPPSVDVPLVSPDGAGAPSVEVPLVLAGVTGPSTDPGPVPAPQAEPEAEVGDPRRERADGAAPNTGAEASQPAEGESPLRRDPHDGWWVVAVALAVLSGFGVRHVGARRELRTARQFATRDPLTGLANRRLFEEAMAREVARRRRTATSLALVLVDLDGFKAVNDSRGHTAGDAVLRRVAEVIDERTRGSDLVARIGGDEFAVVLPDCSSDDADRVGEVLRGAIESAVGPTVTASIGIAAIPDHAGDATELVAAADDALYAAKALGRNRVFVGHTHRC